MLNVTIFNMEGIAVGEMELDKVIIAKEAVSLYDYGNALLTKGIQTV